jgi:hypothetical protein
VLARARRGPPAPHANISSVVHLGFDLSITV